MSSIMWDSFANMGPQALPEGPYDVTVQTASAARSSSNKHMIKVQMAVVTGPLVGQKVWDQIVFSPDSPNSLPFFFGKLAALGLDQAWLSANAPIAFDQAGNETDPAANDRAFAAIAAATIGKTVTATVAIREWNGMPRNEVKAYKASTFQPGVPSMPAAPAPAPAPAPAVPPAAPPF